MLSLSSLLIVAMIASPVDAAIKSITCHSPCYITFPSSDILSQTSCTECAYGSCKSVKRGCSSNYTISVDFGTTVDAIINVGSDARNISQSKSFSTKIKPYLYNEEDDDCSRRIALQRGSVSAFQPPPPSHATHGICSVVDVVVIIRLLNVNETNVIVKMGVSNAVHISVHACVVILVMLVTLLTNF